MTLIGLLMFILVATNGCREKSVISDVFKRKDLQNLVSSAIDGDIQELNKIISNGADINATGIEGVTPLLWVVLHRDYDATETLLKAGANPNKASDFSDTALCIVAGEKNTNLLEILLEYNANPNCINRENDSALNVALLQKRDNNLYMLVKAGADINAHTEFGGTVAVSAAGIGRMDLVEYFLDEGYNYDLLNLRKSISIRIFDKKSNAYKTKKRLLKRLSKYKENGTWWEEQNKARGLIN